MMMMRFKFVCPYVRIIIVTLTIMFSMCLLLCRVQDSIKHNYKYSRYTSKSGNAKVLYFVVGEKFMFFYSSNNITACSKKMSA